MYFSLLQQIESPADLKSLSDEELQIIAAEIRLKLIQVTAMNGGHLASSLGATDIIIAMHSVYNAPVDKLVFDTGHQAYAHKLLTGRQTEFDSLRLFGGLSGFIRKDESPYDVHDSGHASDALSIAMGLALSRDIDGRDERVVALVGDAAISGGMAFEALNQIGHEGRDITIILNDNEMSIAQNVGALSLYLTKVRSSRPYIQTRDSIESRLSSLGNPGRHLVEMGERMRDSAKLFLIGGTFFEDMGITYLGPVDGHSITQLKQVMQSSKQIAGPVLIHAFTQKGKGYLPAEADPELFHGASRFTLSTGQFEAKTEGKSYTEFFGDALVAEAEVDRRIIAVTAAMPKGTGLDGFKQLFPERFFDVGIAEEHAVASAAGMALGGNIPVVAIYSSFLQRAFDQLITNVSLMNQHVVFCLDRAGLVGEDGTTHHGVFDLAYLRTMPNMKIIVPATGAQLADALHTALRLAGPVALRFPRGEAFVLDPPDDAASAAGAAGAADTANAASAAGTASAASATDTANAANVTPATGATPAPKLLEPGKAELLRAGKDVALLAVGRMVKQSLLAADKLADQGVDAAVYNMIWVKPLDTELLASLTNYQLVVTLEEGTLTGGFGSAVLEAMSDIGSADSVAAPRLLRIGIPDEFITHGTTNQLFELLGFDAPSLAETIRQAFDRNTAPKYSKTILADSQS
ncbi:MAG: 1-deoxy-D-xylulose-5-phosphate synthase [Coriobacteriia bacterium]|nr:1-deoxy-D-xylulose-5-phosphate synthase [Coriobacteriia bacterium]